MKIALTVSILLNIGLLSIANNDDKLLNLRGARHSHQSVHGDSSNRLSGDAGDVQVSRLLKKEGVNGADDDDDNEDNYDDHEIDDDADDADAFNDDNYYDDDETGDVDGGDNGDADAFNDDNYYDDDEIGDDASDDHGDNDDDKIDTDVGDDHSDDDEISDENDDDDYSDNETDNIRNKQIRNYRHGKALLINIHITHHGGTTFCHEMKALGPAPEKACNGGSNWNFTVPQPLDRPWNFNETSEYIPIVREHFHMIGWEFGFKPKRPLSDTDWENPLLVSVLIVKDPIVRLFSSDSGTVKKYGDSDHRNQSAWWEYAQLPLTNNFALHKLSPKRCVQSGKDTPLECLEAAQDLVKRFTFVIDIACLDESMAVLADELGWTLPPPKPHKTHPSSAERLGNETLHEWLRQRNRRDIELYEWAKDRAVLNCSALS